MKNNILVLLTIVFLLSFVSAGATLNQPYRLTNTCEGFTCSTMNVTILSPNSTILINSSLMSDNVYYANYTFIPRTLGNHTYYVSDGGNISEGSFVVTTTGNEFNSSQGILYSVLLVVLLFLFMLSTYGALEIPFQNQRNQNNEVVSINWKKYLSIFCYGLSYMFLLGIVFLSWNLTYAYAQWQTLGTFFYYVFRLLMILIYPIVTIIFVMTIVNFVNDMKIEKFISRLNTGY